MPTPESVSSLTDLFFGALLGVAIVAAFWLLASLVDDLRQQARGLER